MSALTAPPASVILFDSGIGGLSVAREIRAAMPGLDINYVADNRIFPYGLQKESVLIERVCALMPILEARYSPGAIVIACNSASTVVLDALRTQTQVPVIGVVPAIKPAAAQSQRRVIGLLATPGTIQRSYTRRLIDQFANDCTVLLVGSSALVSLAENKLRGIPIDLQEVSNIVAPFCHAETPPDIVVLGCTHFPFLREELMQVLPENTRLIDSGEAIARRTRHILEAQGLEAQGAAFLERVPTLHFFFTEETDSAHELAPALLSLGYQDPQYLQI
ncbi:Glutamate racemase [gamma proteobacterium HdN1]|nr:Glutamate racemase [gamma proteobacterium HdN1]